MEELFHKINTSEDRRYLSVTLQNESYAIPLLQVKEVLAPTETTPIPNSPKSFIGLLNLRGVLIPIVDLRVKLNLNSHFESGEKAIVILNLGSISAGVIVDSVDCVESFEEADLSTAPDMDKNDSADYVKSIARKKEKLILILNIEKLLNLETINTIKLAA